MLQRDVGGVFGEYLQRSSATWFANSTQAGKNTFASLGGQETMGIGRWESGTIYYISVFKHYHGSTFTISGPYGLVKSIKIPKLAKL